jgi:hypothetical protein
VILSPDAQLLLRTIPDCEDGCGVAEIPAAAQELRDAGLARGDARLQLTPAGRAWLKQNHTDARP